MLPYIWDEQFSDSSPATFKFIAIDAKKKHSKVPNDVFNVPARWNYFVTLLVTFYFALIFVHFVTSFLSDALLSLAKPVWNSIRSLKVLGSTRAKEKCECKQKPTFMQIYDRNKILYSGACEIFHSYISNDIHMNKQRRTVHALGGRKTITADTHFSKAADM